MKKIPTLFKRDPKDMSRVLDEVNPGCEWVLAGEGTPTRKWDGTCCLVRDGKLYKRREVKKGKPEPADFELSEEDQNTGKKFGWVPVGEGPEDKYHRKAWEGRRNGFASGFWADKNIPETLEDGTYELVGPKVQGGAESHVTGLCLIRHGLERFCADPGSIFRFDARTFNAIQAEIAGMDIEGVVWHHPDGRMAKIKKRDFGLERR